MMIQVPSDAQSQATSAGFATVEDYVSELLVRDAERVAIQKGIDDWKAGKVRSFEEFDRELRKELGFAVRP